METCFAPAKKTESSVFADQVDSISKSPVMSKLMEATSGLLVVLNEHRQIVGLNEAFLDSLGITDSGGVLGLRLGETLHCIHAAELPHGCGTTPHCVTCGAVIATMAAINEGTSLEKTCALSCEKNGVKLEKYLSITARSFNVDERRWILLFAQDITHQHSLATLENIFFHDFSNILMALIGSSELLTREMPDHVRAGQVLNAAKRLCAEVTLQRFLSEQKDEANLLSMSMVSIDDIKKEVGYIVNDHPASQHKKLELIWPDGDIEMHTDIHLVSRVLGNMLLNALEATAEGGIVRLNTTMDDTDVMWEVWNDAYIPSDIQLRIFQKHFSTKSSMGRGVGTHSMKLLGEQYLRGEVGFTSTPEAGTTFSFKHPKEKRT